MYDIGGGIERVEENVGVEDEGLVEERPGQTMFLCEGNTNKLDHFFSQNFFNK